MKILLANPPCRIDLGNGKERFFVRAGSRWPFSVVKDKGCKQSYVPFPFYLAYTAALLEKNDHDVFVIDAIPLNMTKNEFIEKTMEYDPDVILFETSTPTFNYDIQLVDELKKLKNFTIVLTGSHVTTYPEESLKKCKNIDYIFKNEYELNFNEFIKAFSNGKGVDKIPGIGFMNNEKMIVNETELTPLEKLPIPARQYFPTNDYCNLSLYREGVCLSDPSMIMHISRGCPFRCDFCLWVQVMYKDSGHRTFPLEHIFNEIEDAMDRFGIKAIYFDDDIFTGNKKFVLQFCEEMKKRKLGIEWSVMGDAMITDEEMINTMADAGCIGFKFGVESGNKEVLKNIQKPINFDKVKRVATTCAKRGIKSHATFSFGLSGDTRASMEDTMKFACELDVDSVQFSISTPFPGTRYYKKLKEKDMLLTDNWNAFDGGSTSVVKDNTNLTHKEIEDFYKKASSRWLKYKLKDPKWVWRQLKYLNKLRAGQGNYMALNKLKRGLELITA